MNKVYILLVEYDEYEDRMSYPIAVFDNAVLTEEAKAKYIEHNEYLKSIEDPNKDIKTKFWSEEQAEKWYEWNEVHEYASNFKFCSIQEFELNKIKIS